jgi:PHD/YefM family antitoxin component YafN of YafNO toxin-antitoxin module
VLPTSEARQSLTQFLKVFREEGAEAEPIFFGAQRKPEAVVLSYEAYDALLDALDDGLIAREVQARDAADSGERMSLDELIRSQGLATSAPRRSRCSPSSSPTRTSGGH